MLSDQRFRARSVEAVARLGLATVDGKVRWVHSKKRPDSGEYWFCELGGNVAVSLAPKPDAGGQFDLFVRTGVGLFQVTFNGFALLDVILKSKPAEESEATYWKHYEATLYAFEQAVTGFGS